MAVRGRVLLAALSAPGVRWSDTLSQKALVCGRGGGACRGSEVASRTHGWRADNGAPL